MSLLHHPAFLRKSTQFTFFSSTKGSVSWPDWGTICRKEHEEDSAQTLRSRAESTSELHRKRRKDFFQKSFFTGVHKRYESVNSTISKPFSEIANTYQNVKNVFRFRKY
jgi:hypothetical protein